MNNKFKIVIPSYNNEKWTQVHVESILNQNYSNYEVLYIDDCSTDNTRKEVEKLIDGDKRWKIITNPKNMRRGYNISPVNPNIKKFMDSDDDILVFIDGDDWLATDDVLNQLNKFYNDNDCWMSYGGYLDYPELKFPGGRQGNQNTEYPPEIHRKKSYRTDWWRASHLRTFKWFLYRRIKDEDLRYSKTGEYYFHAEDLASSYPCLEMCPPEKIGVHDFVTYMFNNTPTNRERGIAREQEAGDELEIEIRTKSKYDFIPQITANIVMPSNFNGMHNFSLANKMFQIATVLGLSEKYDCRAVFPDLKNEKLHSNYKDNIFRNLAIDGDKSFVKNRYEEVDFSYNEIPYKDNLELTGYYQSEKYFKDSRNLILEKLCPDDDTIKKIKEKYGDDIIEATSCHIRRKDYLAISDHHPVLSETDYYEKALNQFPKDTKFLVFSDDIDWCKENLKGYDFTFISEPDYMDLWIMSLCKNNIIANSSFSWWGAWLNKNENKKVIAPKLWFGPKKVGISDKDIIPKEWIRI